jgi:hypothetical protein
MSGANASPSSGNPLHRSSPYVLLIAALPWRGLRLAGKVQPIHGNLVACDATGSSCRSHQEMRETQMGKSFYVVLLAAAIAGVSSPALSHHSHAMFDHTVEKTITGTVTNFSFRNPHVFLYLDVKGEDGQVVKWAVEMSNIQNTVRSGIRQSTFKAGDVVTVTLNPLRDGRPGGNFTSITAADGKIYR